MENGVRHKFTMKSYGIMSAKLAKIMLRSIEIFLTSDIN